MLLPVGLDPSNKSEALLLSTNTEVSIAPKLHSRQQPPGRTDKATVATQSTPLKSQTSGILNSQILRVLPALPQHQLPVYSDTLVGFVSPATFRDLYPSAGRNPEGLYEVKVKRRSPPPDMDSSSSEEPSAPTPKVLKPSSETTGKTVTEDEKVYIVLRKGIVASHIIFPTLPQTIEEWDLIQFVSSLFW